MSGVELRGMAADRWENDPKLLGTMLARYKFVARMLQGYGDVLEVGCHDGFGARVVRQHVQRLSAVDVDADAVAVAAAHSTSTRWPVQFFVHDMRAKPLLGFDGAYSLDVLEHVHPDDERAFLTNLRASAPVCVVGMPTLESQAYASEASRAEHVNCKTVDGLRQTMERYWAKAFMFGMNDEALHVGFAPMTHYVLALGVG